MSSAFFNLFLIFEHLYPLLVARNRYRYIVKIGILVYSNPDATPP
jgi:hypothetical protein